MHGALAFAVPLQFGQLMEVFETNSTSLEWYAYERGKIWLNFSLSLSDIENQQECGNTEKEFVCYLLNKAKQLNPNFLHTLSVKVRTEIDFDRNWGLGSSSSLINNVAQWADVNPYELHAMVSKGSGYDIACANYCKPILFRRNRNHPLIYPVDFAPSFTDQLYFIYLGNKQKSEESVNSFLSKNIDLKAELGTVSLMSKKLLQAQNPYEFDTIVEEHENLMSNILKCQPVKNMRFADFDGSIKSLGAWGGDFVLARTDITKREVYQYFFQKGLTTIFSWDEIVLQ